MQLRKGKGSRLRGFTEFFDQTLLLSSSKDVDGFNAVTAGFSQCSCTAKLMLEFSDMCVEALWFLLFNAYPREIRISSQIFSFIVQCQKLSIHRIYIE